MITFNGKRIGLMFKTNVEMPSTFIITDENGKAAVASYVGEEPVFTATPNDIREGTVAATSEGVTVGTKIIPSYNTTEGFWVIMKGEEFEIPSLAKLDCYDYTKFQAIICPYAGSVAESVASDKVAIDGKVYPAKSNEPLKTIRIDHDNKTINFNIINGDEDPYLIRYFTYKEIH